MLAELPPVAIESMTPVQLTELIPQLVQLSTGRQHPLFGRTQYKPEWWPDSTPWVKPEAQDSEKAQEVLKELVRSCYKHLGQESSLLAGDISPSKPASSKVDQGDGKENQTADQNRSATQENDVTTTTTDKGDNDENDQPIWICFLCAKQFVNQDLLMEHQDECEKEQEVLEARQRLEQLAREKEQLERLAQERERLAELGKQREIITRQRKVQYREKLNLHRQHIQRQREKMRQEEQEVMQKAPTVARPVFKRKKRLRPEIYIPPPKPLFIQSLGLQEKPKDEQNDSVSKAEVDSDCEIIEVSLPEGVEAPLTPRTPKSLMSQLSRDPDAHVRRRHLSFAGVVTDSDSADESLENEAKKKPSVALSALLYGIDLTSVLGHRVKKHLKKNSDIPVIENYELYCKGPSKNEFIEKLRQSDRSYPVVYRPRRKTSSKFVHEYKFNSAQKREFMITKATGLTKRSRKLLRYVKNCKVTLKRLKPSVIKEWTRRKPKPVIRHPMQPMPMLNMNDPQLRQILSKPLYGPKSARIRQINENISRLRTAQLVSGSNNQYEMVTRIVKNPDGSETMKIIYVPKQVTGAPVAQPTFSRSHLDNSRRKQSFHPTQIRDLDDDIQIIELSDSSDEEEDARKSQLFCKDCRPGMRCRTHAIPMASTKSFGGVRPTALHRNTAVRQSSIRGSNRPPQPSGLQPRSAVFTSTGLRFTNSAPPMGTTVSRPSLPSVPGAKKSALREILTSLPNTSHEGLTFTDLQKISAAGPKPQTNIHQPENIRINPLTPEQQQNFQGVMRTVVGPDGQMRVQCEPLAKPKPTILRKPPLKPVESNKPDEAIVLDDDD